MAYLPSNTPESFEVVAGDLRACFTNQKDNGGFAHVELYDADDHDRFFLGEDAAIGLYRWLGAKLRGDGLIDAPVPSSALAASSGRPPGFYIQIRSHGEYTQYGPYANEDTRLAAAKAAWFGDEDSEIDCDQSTDEIERVDVLADGEIVVSPFSNGELENGD